MNLFDHFGWIPLNLYASITARHYPTLIILFLSKQTNVETIFVCVPFQHENDFINKIIVEGKKDNMTNELRSKTIAIHLITTDQLNGFYSYTIFRVLLFSIQFDISNAQIRRLQNIIEIV